MRVSYNGNTLAFQANDSGSISAYPLHIMKESDMSYKLFIDDERFPVKPDWFMCRSSKEAINAVRYYGLPEYISFDHDLGGDDTSMLFIDWLLNRLLDGDLTIDGPFDFTVHSQNPIGAKNIENRMRSIINHFK